tara:strand:- start:128 stop:409 length:282 start_codon:yes stop_codon:yes gene_type:complete
MKSIIKKDFQMEKIEKIFSVILSIVGIVLVVDVFLEQFFSIGTKQNSLTLIYCISFIILTTKFKSILKNKFVMIPLYLMIVQTIYSLGIKYVV